jgi:hypothetical protein
MDSSDLYGDMFYYYFEQVVFKKQYEVKDLIKIPSYSKAPEPTKGTQDTTKTNIEANETFGGYSKDTLNNFGGKLKIPLYYTRDYE